MATEKCDNVTELLKQLEELKAKKARHLKKLKRKLGRSSLLNQSSSSIQNSSNLSVKNDFSLKSEACETRNVLAQLNSKCDGSSINILSTKSQCNAFKQLNTTTHQSDVLPNKDISFIPSSVGLGQPVPNSDVEFHSICNLDHKSVDISNTVSSNRKRSSNSCKRSVDEHFDNFTEANKKTKTSERKCSDPSRNSAHSGNIQDTGVSDTSKPVNEIFDNDQTVNCLIDSSVNFFSSQITEVEGLSSNPHVLPRFKSEELNVDLREIEDCSTQNDKVDISEGNKLNYLADEILVIPETIDLIGKNCSNLPVAPDLVEKDCSDFHLVKEVLTNEMEDNIDLNVFEIADTEFQFDLKSQSVENSSGQQNVKDSSRDSKDVYVSKFSSDNAQPEVAYFAEVSREDFNPAVNDEKKDSGGCAVNSKDIYVSKFSSDNVKSDNAQPEVAYFAEISPEDFNPAVNDEKRDSGGCAVNDRYTSSQGSDRRGSDAWDFTDEEDNDTRYINSQEIDALFQSDYEEDKVEGGSNSVFEVPEENISTSQQCTADVETGVLIVPETDDIAHNVCIATEVIEEDMLEDNPADDTGQTTHCNALNLDTSKVDKPTLNAVDISTVSHHDMKSELKDCGDEALKEVIDSEMHFQVEDSPETEDFLKLVNCFSAINTKSDLVQNNEISEEVSSLKFQCCLQSEITERVTKMKLTTFNNSVYLFILHLTWVQAWRLEKGTEWTKIFAHQVESFQMQEMCVSHNEDYLVLIMLLKAENESQCLQFSVFEKESRLIKIMEHTHWFEKSCTDVFLCGLDELKFAVAQGGKTFEVYCHSFSGLESSPRLLTVSLGTTTDHLHSLCRMDKLPNALLGMSEKMLYVWHVLEGRLVTSVCLQMENSLTIGSCIWATIESGLVFLISECGESLDMCNLLAVNLATGFSEVASTYTLQPAQESASQQNRCVVYCEPFIGAICDSGAYLWSVEEEYCCAKLKPSNYTSIAIASDSSFLIAVGCNSGYVNCYEMRCTEG